MADPADLADPGVAARSRLYPYLDRDEAGSSNESRLPGSLEDSIRSKSAASSTTQQEFFEVNGTALIEAARSLATVYRQSGRLLCMGNGGSSCDAAHVAVEFNHPVTAGRPALPAINLTADVPMLTAIGNDVGIREIFQRQVIAHGRRGDALLGLSTSGGSVNLLAAFEEARRRELLTIALLGGDGGAIAASGVVDHCLVVASDSIHRIQETHVVAYHILWDLVHSLLKGEPG